MKKEHYVYVYCNPLKPGKFTYYENGFGIDFDHEPFYIGEGKNGRIYDHLSEAKNSDKNSHKLNTIRKLFKSKQEPIMYKIFENLGEVNSLLIEKCLIKLVGRDNLKLGPLTNLTDGGKGLNNPSIITKTKIGLSRLNKPIEEKLKINIKCNKTKIKNRTTSKREDLIFRFGEEEAENIIYRRTKSFRENHNSKDRKGKKFEEIYGKEKSNEWRYNLGLAHSGEKNGMFNKHHSIETKQKISKKRIEEGTGSGKNNSRYIKIHYKFLLEKYFEITNRKDVIKKYENTFNFKISLGKYSQFLNILNFPVNCISKFTTKIIIETYLNFVEKNKNKLQWYIDNYERLEKEYFKGGIKID